MEFHDLGKHCTEENCGQQGASMGCSRRFKLTRYKCFISSGSRSRMRENVSKENLIIG